MAISSHAKLTKSDREAFDVILYNIYHVTVRVPILTNQISWPGGAVPKVATGCRSAASQAQNGSLSNSPQKKQTFL